MTYEFDEVGIPLPVGAVLPGATVRANPMMRLQFDSYTVHEETPSGWPTSISIQRQNNAGSAGVVVDYLGTWHDHPIDEVDLLFDPDDREWWAVVAYRDQSSATAQIRVEHSSFGAIEWFEWNTFEPQDLIDAMHRGRTPVAYDPDKPSNSAIAFQQCDSLDDLAFLFGFEGFTTINQRAERIYRRVTPREVRWADYDTTQTDHLRAIYESTVESSEDEPGVSQQPDSSSE